MVDDIYDITVLGGGPAGLFSAFYAGLRESRCKIIDSMPLLGGRLMAVYPEKYIYDIGGLPKILAKDLVTNLIEQIEPYKPQINLEEHVQNIEMVSDEELFHLNSAGSSLWKITTDKKTHYTKTIILAAGTGLYSPKKHSASSAELFEERGISYAVLNKQAYAGKNVVILGGGDSALDWANELVSIAQSVTLVHRSDKFRAHGASVQKLMQTPARILLNHEAIDFIGNSHLSAIKLQNVDTFQELLIDCNAAVILFGFSNTLGKIEEWNLELYDGGVLVNSKMQTNLPGVFAAGDIARYEGKLDLIATGFSEAATAVAFAKNHINPKIKPQPLYSTTVMEIKEKKRPKL